MKRAASKEVELFSLMAEWFAAHWTNAFIRMIYASGVPVEVTDTDACTTTTYVYRPTILTDKFLNAARALHSQIANTETRRLKGTPSITYRRKHQ